MSSLHTLACQLSGSLLLFFVSISLASCSRDGAAQAQPQGPPPAGVSMVTLATRPIEQTSDFIATVQSLRSSTIQPEVEGIVTRIFVRSGDRVNQGAPIVQIDQEKQQATVRTAEANLTGAQADVTYWRAQVQRYQALVSAGAVSKQEYEQAQNTLRTAEARVAALQAQVREGRVQLGYYLVNAPQAGTIGDIPIRVGDRVTNSTVITTIDERGAFEVYVQVPLDRSPDLRLGLPVQLLDASGKVVATNPITFIAPRVEDNTQTVLVKSRLKEMPASVRVQQFVRARIIWRSADGLTVPVTAVTRISGQYFCYVAEPGPNGGLVAKQRPLQVGEVLGNDYVVVSGLKAGDRLITSGIQKLGDGAPVTELKG